MNNSSAKKFRQFTHGLLRTPPHSMANGITTQNQVPDIALAQKQHKTYETVLRSLNLNLTILAPEENFPDCHFVEDAAIVHRGAAIMTRPGAKSRLAEGDSLRPSLAKNLEIIDLDVSLKEAQEAEKVIIDGGDVLFMGQHVLIGISARTTFLGAKAMANALKAIDTELHCHFIEFSGLLHLKSGLTALNEECLLATTAITLKSPLPFCKIMYVPVEENYAANALVINGHALHFAECRRTADLIASVDLQPIAMELSEFKKMDGSFTCLSLLW